nr:hypothetical protein [Brevundimonas naejangsanensis]
MNENKERNLQHAMMSFALFGGMLVNTKQMNGAGDRVVSHPSAGDRVVSHPSNFVPITIKRPRA